MRMLYSIYSKYRKSEYEIFTALYKNNDIITVKKVALNDLSREHIMTINENYKIMVDIYGCEHVAKTNMINESTIEMEYIYGESFLDKVKKDLENNDLKAFYNKLIFYAENLLSKNKNENFTLSFEKSNAPERNVNIDMTFENIILNNDTFTIIDYEWVYPDAPQAFVLYRALFEFFGRHKLLFQKNKISYQELMNLFNIKDLNTFINMNTSFSNSVSDLELRKYERKIIIPVF